MNVLLTGATGYIGTKLLESLEASGGGPIKKVYALSRGDLGGGSPPVEWVKTDLGRPGWVANLPDGPVDVVVHLAQSRRYREFPDQITDIFNINTRSTLELAQWAHARKVKRFIFASTGNVYGFGDRAHKETDACMPDSMYGASKLSAENLLRPFAPFFDVAILRFFGVYGPGQTNALIPDIIRRFVNGEEITLAGNVGVKFNPMYIDDAVAVISKVASERLFTGYEVMNAGNPDAMDLRQIAGGLESITKDAARLRVVDGQPKYLVGEIGKIQKLLKVGPFVRFQDGLRSTFASLAETLRRA